MPIIATNESKSLPIVEPGTHIARCVQMIHVGTIKEQFEDKDIIKNVVRVTFEIPGVTHTFDESKGAEPRLLSKEFTLSLNPKATLRKFLDTWRGKPFTPEQANKFDVSTLIGVPCMLSIGKKTSAKNKEYNTIDSAIAVPNGVPVPDAFNQLVEINFDNIAEHFKIIPNYIVDKIKTTPEYQQCGFTFPDSGENSTENVSTDENTSTEQKAPETDEMPF